MALRNHLHDQKLSGLNKCNALVAVFRWPLF
jgi:hypothetical protein